MLKKSLYPLVLFFCFLGWFVLNGAWYQKSQLIIKGYVPDNDTTLEARWDSGNGYNKYENELFSLDTILPPGAEQHEIIIRNTGEKNKKSLHGKIILSTISIDGITMDPGKFASLASVAFLA